MLGIYWTPNSQQPELAISLSRPSTLLINCLWGLR
jgi:hypothetical protein